MHVKNKVNKKFNKIQLNNINKKFDAQVHNTNLYKKIYLMKC